jgi:hypothetical protein
MRKIFILAIMMCVSFPSFNLAAQDQTGISYTDRTLLGADFSLISYRYGYVGSRSIGVPAVSAYLQIGMHENITVGPFVGYARWNYHHTGLTPPLNYYWSFTTGGARGSLHLTSYLNNIFGMDIDDNKLDWNVTALLGLEYRQYSAETANFHDLYSNEVNIIYGLLGGLRYYLGNNMAVSLEVGRGNLGVIMLGISLLI